MADAPVTFCTNCGAHLAADERFCGVCGHPRAPAAHGPHGVAPVGPPPAPKGQGGPWLLIAGIVATIALLAGVLTIIWVVRSGDSATAEEVTLEPIAYQTPDPFTPSVTSGPETPPPAGAVKVTSGGSSPGGQQVPGAQPGLYGGTRNAATCNPDQLVSFLQGDPGKAAAWAAVLGIGPGEIAGYVHGLTPILLTRDTRVTNHGFANGRATTVPAVLQAGTAVLVDRFGVPRVKCGCGNPLTEPTPITSVTTTGGTPWPGFAMATTVSVTATVTVTTFVLVDVNTGRVYARPAGTTGSADGDRSRDDLCHDFPSDGSCQTTTSTTASASTTTTAASTTTTAERTTTSVAPTEPAPTTAPATTTAPADDASLAAIAGVRTAVSQCGQGGSLGAFSAVELRAGVYRVTVDITFEGGTEPVNASWSVDLSSGHPQIVPEDPAAAALICLGN